MSLNGDIVVMRNGRSTSQVSVYNYPEHLNPFYEDDQHKRLRFWHINKNKNGGEGRRNSFSIGGLKDMWAFKSFRTKKKSSTLGINKTSESPPQLRRDMQYGSNNGFYTFDDRLSRCVSNGNPTNGGTAFQRNIPYRSSLQNVNASGKATSGDGIGFNRNDQYRSTTQFGGVQRRQQQQMNTMPASRRYVYGGSVTPQPLRSGGGSEYGRGNFSGGTGADLARGSSQISVLTASSNPFDSDDNEDEEDMLSGAGSSPTSPTRRTPRKKRRAPAPPVPVPVHKLNTDARTHLSTASSHPNPPQSEQLPELHIEEELNIANLTAQIESLVDKDADNGVDKDVKPADQSRETPTKCNGAIPKESIISAKTPPPPSQIIATAKETQVAHPAAERRVQEEVIYDTPVLTQKPINNSNDSKAKSEEVGHVECIHIHVESPRATPEPEPVPSRVTSFQPEHKNERKEVMPSKTSYTLSSPTAMRRDTRASATGQERIVVVTTNTVEKSSKNTSTSSPKVSKVDELKITETPKESNDSKLKITEDPKPSNVVHNTDAATKPINKPPIANKPNLEGKTRVSFQAEVHKPTTISESKTSEEVGRPAANLENSTNFEYQNHQSMVPETIRVVEATTAEIRRPTTQLKNDAQKPESMHVVVAASTEEVRKPTSSAKSSTNFAPEMPKSICIVETTTITTKTESKEAPLASEMSALPALKIVESKETAIVETSSNQKLITPPIGAPPPMRPMRSRDEFEALYRPKPPSTHLEWKQSTLAPLETNVPPEKRKSVKDIIESINRSQRLLKNAANKEMSQSAFSDSEDSGAPIAAKRHHLGTSTTTTTTTTSAIPRKLSEPNNDLNQRQRNESSRRLFEASETSTSHQTNGNAGAESETFAASDGDLEQNNNNDPQKLNNAEVFQKCVITKEVYQHRESSPTASNLDWNPVPKPKRTKNLAEI